MTAWELLSRIASIQKEIDFRKEKIEDLNERAEGLSVRRPDASGAQRSDVSPMATAVCSRIKIEDEIARLEAERDSLVAVIERVDDDNLRLLLYLRYVRRLPWEDINAKLHYCRSNTFRLHQLAINRLDSVLQESNPDTS